MIFRINSFDLKYESKRIKNGIILRILKLTNLNLKV